MTKHTYTTPSNIELQLTLTALSVPADRAEEIISKRDIFEGYGINTPKRWACFLGQCAHESVNFSVLEENLYYRASSIVRTWPSRFKTERQAQPYAQNPRKLANKVYGNRMGNTDTNDGYLYRGRGVIQLTGKNNYIAAGAFIGMDLESAPEMVETSFLLALLTAAWYFTKTKYQKKSILEWADTMSHKAITKAINGGIHGLLDRTYNSNYALSMLTTDNSYFKLPVLRVGDKNKEVRIMQTCLKRLGYQVIKIDGHYGKRTQQALIQFQKDYNLTPDGIVGGNTYSALISTDIPWS